MRPNGKVNTPAMSSAPVTIPRTLVRCRARSWVRADHQMIGTWTNVKIDRRWMMPKPPVLVRMPNEASAVARIATT